MATAVTNAAEPQPQPRGTGPSAVNPRTRLGVASLVGAALVIAGIAVAAYVVPQAWRANVSPTIAPLGSFVDVFVRLAVQVLAVVVVVSVGNAVAGRNPPRGLRGGITLAVSAAVAIFFVVRAVGLNLEPLMERSVALLVTLVVLGGLLGLAMRWLFSAGGQRLMLAVEEQGWLHTFGYKPLQGQMVRRYTLLGLLLVGWSGVYSLVTHENLGRGDWLLNLPFTETLLAPLADIQYSVPVLLAAATFWLAWRAVNMPAFADFLIATEAEMNKVSWSSRKRLIQDTVVVLVTTLLLTAFLLVTDLFWGWLLSAVKVLPGRSQAATQVDASGQQKLRW